jgi:protein-tyrosine phosphatase
MVEWLLGQGITYCLDLTEDGECGLRPYVHLLFDQAYQLGRKVVHQRMPIRDYSIPTISQMSRILDTIDEALADGHVVYLHCFGGVGRTGMVVGCYLVRHGMQAAAALDQIVRWRQSFSTECKMSPETEDQRKFVLDWGM